MVCIVCSKQCKKNRKKESSVSMKMEDKKSFMYVIVSALLPTHHTVVNQKIKGICMTSAILKMYAENMG